MEDITEKKTGRPSTFLFSFNFIYIYILLGLAKGLIVLVDVEAGASTICTGLLILIAGKVFGDGNSLVTLLTNINPYYPYNQEWFGHDEENTLDLGED